jgi:hypothetical protein
VNTAKISIVGQSGCVCTPGPTPQPPTHPPPR